MAETYSDGAAGRMRLVFLGSGAFGLPTLEALHAVHDVALVVTQPDRPAGRRRQMTPTPVAAFSEKHGLTVRKPDDVNDAAMLREIGAIRPDAIIVIAYGQKLSPELCAVAPTINLHGSLLPKYRGAAPINWAMIHGETRAGIAVIDVARRMDAGAVYGTAATRIEPTETAGELHDRLAELGPDLMLDVLEQIRAGRANPRPQDETQATSAPKLHKAQGTVRFDQPADAVRARINGLNPWPGCTVLLGEQPLKLLRASVADGSGQPGVEAGTILSDHTVACRPGTVRLMAVQPPGGKSMTFDAYCNGRNVRAGARLAPMDHANS